MSQEKQARPWDIFRKNAQTVTKEITQKRLSICAVCPEYVRLTAQCKKCGCFMKAKAASPDSSCPIGKWNRVVVSYKEEGEVDE
jgi:hypothetical protein